MRRPRLVQGNAPPFPSLRFLAAAFTFGRHVALFGGYKLTNEEGEHLTDRHTRPLRAHTWKKLKLDPAPRRRLTAMFAWDPQRKEAVLYGGTNDTGDVFSDTWTLRRG